MDKEPIVGVFVDLETGGLDPERDAILQIAGVMFREREGELITGGGFSVKVIPEDGLSVSHAALTVQGKSWSDVPTWFHKDVHSESQALLMFLAWMLCYDEEKSTLRPQQIWAHNASFDSGFLYNASKRHGINNHPLLSERCRYSCSQSFWKILQGAGVAPAEIGSSLSSISKNFAIRRNHDAHDALEDCYAGIGCLSEMMKLAGWL